MVFKEISPTRESDIKTTAVILFNSQNGITQMVLFAYEVSRDQRTFCSGGDKWVST